MRNWLFAALAALALGVAGPTFAGASGQAKHQCSFDLTARFAEVKVNSGNPPQNGSNTSAATIDGKLCGKRFHGAARDVNEYPTLGKFDGQIVNFGPLGSIKGKFRGTANLNPNGSDLLHGKGSITGGSGLYTGATGSLSFTGTKPANSVTTQHIIGTLHY